VAGRERHGPGRAVAGLRIAAAAAVVGLAAACGTAASTTSAGRTDSVLAAAQQASGTTITETGSTLLYPLAGTWAKAYHQQHPGVTVTTAGTGSGAGIEDASDGAADIGASDAYLSSGDLVKNPALLNIPLAVSAQTIIYNVPGLPPGTL
jgi:phosphate transport system substrate-binding protein